MAIREIIRLGHPLLRQVAEPVPLETIHSSSIQQLVIDLWDTKEAADGLGLAAPQIAESVQVAVVEVHPECSRYEHIVSSEKFTIINPVVEYLTQHKAGMYEGCLSLPNLRGFVERAQKIKVDFYNENAEPRSLVLDGFLAVVFQHEIDHLFGTLYIDRMADMKTLSFEEEFRQFYGG